MEENKNFVYIMGVFFSVIKNDLQEHYLSLN